MTIGTVQVVLLVCFAFVAGMLVNNLRVAFKSDMFERDVPVGSVLPIMGDDPLATTTTTTTNKAQPNTGADEQYDWSPRPYEPNPRPPLKDIVVGWNITGDPQWLINFAVAAFPKTGTSSLMHYFADNKEVQIFKDERCELGTNQHARLIEDHYSNLTSGDYVRGIKCPRLLENDLGMVNYQQWFPKTDLIVGIRHPVKWFESFYNHRVYNGFNMRPITELIGSCNARCFSCYTDRANFHVYLAAMGKTPLSEIERELMPKWAPRMFNNGLYTNITGRVFLYEVDQLSDKNPDRSYRFRKDLQRYLYLRNELPPMVWFKPGTKKYTPEEDKKARAKKVDICEPQYKEVRTRLMEHAVNASAWIREYFMGAPGTVVSSPEYFEELLMTYNKDPCDDGYKAASAEMNCTASGCFMMDHHHNKA